MPTIYKIQSVLSNQDVYGDLIKHLVMESSTN